MFQKIAAHICLYFWGASLQEILTILRYTETHPFKLLELKSSTESKKAKLDTHHKNSSALN